MELPQRKRNRLEEGLYKSGRYYVTINVQDRIHSFGKVKNGQMILNEYGKIAYAQRKWLQKQYPYVILDSFIVMPDHIHGILCIQDMMDDEVVVGDGRGMMDDEVVVGDGRGMMDDEVVVGDGRDRPLLNVRTESDDHHQPKTKSLSSLIGAFKTTSSKQIHEAGGISFRRQRSFYDHIVRNEEDLNRIRSYIIDNPHKREENKN